MIPPSHLAFTDLTYGILITDTNFIPNNYYHQTSLTLALFIGVSVPSHGNMRHIWKCWRYKRGDQQP